MSYYIDIDKYFETIKIDMIFGMVGYFLKDPSQLDEKHVFPFLMNPLITNFPSTISDASMLAGY